MRAATLFLTLLPAISFAQPTVGPEILSALLPPRNEVAYLAAPAVAMARDANRAVIGWTAQMQNGVNAIYVARLDAAGHVMGAVHTIPTAADAFAPSIAKSMSGGFVVAWVELNGMAVAGTAVIFYCRLDENLNPSTPQILVTFDASKLTDPPIVRSSSSDWITADGLVWQIGPDGLLNGVSSGVSASDMAATSTFPIIVGVRQTQELTSCACPMPRVLCGCPVYSTALSLQVVWLYVTGGAWSLPFDTNGRPAVETDGPDALIAWFEGVQRNGGLVVAARLKPGDNPFQREIVLGPFGGETAGSRPDIAIDGNRSVVVWRTRTAAGDYDVIGAWIDNANNVHPLTIATSSANERDPSVTALGGGKFLVAYEKLANGERRLAGRFIEFGERRRAAQ